MQITCFEIKGWEKNLYKKALSPKHKLAFYTEPLSDQNLDEIKNCEVLSIFIYSHVTKAVLAKLPKLKLITTRSTGFDHIDLAECQKRKITVCNVPFYGENTVAEHTFALILSLSRNVHKSYLRTISHNYTIEGLQGFDLKGKTLGVIGAGRIGLHVIRMAKGFGMKVIAFDVNQDHFIAEVLDFKYAPLEELLKKSDIITLHAPYNEHTHHLINQQKLSLVKKGALLINTSRGGLIDTDALIEALDKKILSGAGLDVLEGEELIKEEKQLLYDKEKVKNLNLFVKDHILLSKENVVFTPHIAFYSQEALARILNTSIENLQNFLAGKKTNTVKL